MRAARFGSAIVGGVCPGAAGKPSAVGRGLTAGVGAGLGELVTNPNGGAKTQVLVAPGEAGVPGVTTVPRVAVCTAGLSAGRDVAVAVAGPAATVWDGTAVAPCVGDGLIVEVAGTVGVAADGPSWQPAIM